MMHTYVSDTFSGRAVGRRLYDALRETIVADYRAATGSDRTVRIPRDAIRIDMLSGDRWLPKESGLSSGLATVGPSGRYRWRVCVKF